ncbi:hypothetical protein [Pedobacter sp. L105]|uniref:hypothetical protein n=1 Tax=Pedobacter sp. L105 TaxID=1641871 RepID=UPI00131B9D87|nr:hypothetical protein [Pedobacter sp. L105]
MKTNDWIDINDQRPGQNQQVMVCDINVFERDILQIVTYTGKINNEWLYGILGKTEVPLNYFTHWMPIDVDLPKESAKSMIQQFEDDLAIKNRGETLTVTVNLVLSETFIDNAIFKRAKYSNWNVHKDMSKRPLLVYTIN